jgi:hypothetical protein
MPTGPRDPVGGDGTPRFVQEARGTGSTFMHEKRKGAGFLFFQRLGRVWFPPHITTPQIVATS